MRILDNQELKKSLLTRKPNPEKLDNESNFIILPLPNKSQTLKQIEIYEKEQQGILEEKIRSRKLFELYEEKPMKKVKKAMDEVILLDL